MTLPDFQSTNQAVAFGQSGLSRDTANQLLARRRYHIGLASAFRENGLFDDAAKYATLGQFDREALEAAGRTVDQEAEKRCRDCAHVLTSSGADCIECAEIADPE